MNPDAATLRLAVLPRIGVLADTALVIAGAGLVALSAQIAIPLPFTPVPLSGQTFAVVLVGASLGSVRGVASLVLYVGAGLVGAPVYANEHGLAALSAPSGGYILGFVLAAAVTGLLAERRWDRRLGPAVGAMLLGNAAIYLVGLPWLAAVVGSGPGRTLELGLYPFVAGDLLKVALAAALLPGAWRLVERLGRDGGPRR